MKAFHLGALWLFLISGGMNAQYDGRFERVLEAYIKEDNKSADKTIRDRIASSWSGISTMDGIRSIVRELLKPTGGDRRGSSFELLERSEVPRDQIVSYLLESAEAHRGDLVLFVQHFFLFSEYPEDDRILKFLAPMLENKTVSEPYRKLGPREERDNEARYRLCDSVHGAILQILEKRGEIKPGDPGYGDPGGEATISKREINIAQLEPMLVRSGYLAAAQPAANPPPDPAPPEATPPPNPSRPGDLAIGIPKDDASELPSADSTNQVQVEAGQTNWLAWMAGGVLVLGLGWFVWKKRG